MPYRRLQVSKVKGKMSTFFVFTLLNCTLYTHFTIWNIYVALGKIKRQNIWSGLEVEFYESKEGKRSLEVLIGHPVKSAVEKWPKRLEGYYKSWIKVLFSRGNYRAFCWSHWYANESDFITLTRVSPISQTLGLPNSESQAKSLKCQAIKSDFMPFEQPSRVKIVKATWFSCSLGPKL